MSTKTGFLSGKKLLITGVLSNRSIAYGIAKACHEQGAELAFSYVGERFKDRITEFAADFGSKLIFDCDVGSDQQIEQMGRLCHRARHQRLQLPCHGQGGPALPQ
jgi:enoyl-[acyl-carrier protein] reductase I